MAGRVFIIGAGASREDTKHLDLPMPLAHEFFTSECLDNHWPNAYAGLSRFADSALAKILQHYFGFSLSSKGKSSRSLINVEEVYSFIETCLQVYPSRIFERELLEQARRELLQYIVHVIRYVPWTLHKPKLHHAIISSLKAGDSVITFNWDLLFDHLFAKSKKGKKYLELQAELLNPFAHIASSTVNYEDTALKLMHEGYFLKLHGSVNFAICKNDACVHHSIPYRFGMLEEFPESWDCRACASPLEVMIVPPYVHKSYLANRLLSLQANIAAGKLARAQEIVIIGYSMPVFDFQARTLMRIARLEPMESDGSETFLKRLVVVNPQVSRRMFIDQVKDVFGVRQAERAYGHKLKLVLYKTATEYLNEELSVKSSSRKKIHTRK